MRQQKLSMLLSVSVSVVFMTGFALVKQATAEQGQPDRTSKGN